MIDLFFQWNQECLGCLLRLITQFSVCQSDLSALQDYALHESTQKKSGKKHRRVEKIIIPRLNQVCFSSINLYCKRNEKERKRR